MLFLLLSCTGYEPPKETGETGFDETAVESAQDSGETGDTGETSHSEDSTPLPTDEDGDRYPSDEDCDDTDPAVHPGAEEVCNTVDDDCDGLVDDDDDATTGQNRFFPDTDGDGYGADTDPTLSCALALEGYVGNAGDCDDTDPAVFPRAIETCNLVDDNCDGTVDEGFPATPWYRDEDADGYGRSTDVVKSCEAPRDHAAAAGDCDDLDPAIHPEAAEVCDEVDNNCDGNTDEGIEVPTWYRDADGDGYGSRGTTRDACTAPAGYVANGDDCEDADPARCPGVADPCNDVDDDCDGALDEDIDLVWYTDTDGDGYGAEGSARAACDQPFGTSATPGDCDDTSDLVFPGASETCNGADDNCDGLTDEAC